MCVRVNGRSVPGGESFCKRKSSKGKAAVELKSDREGAGALDAELGQV